MSNREQYVDMVLEWLEYDTGVSDLVVLVIQSLPERYESMARAIKAGDVETFAGLVHSLKGTAGNFHMNEIYQLALDMDLDLKSRGAIDDIAFTFMDQFHVIVENIPEEYYLMEVMEESFDGESQGFFRVLIGAATDDQCRQIRRMLLGQPIEIVFALTGPDVLSSILAHPCDLLIMDVQEAVMEAEKVLMSIKDYEASKRPYTIIVTSEKNKDEIKCNQALGIDEYMSKPIDKTKMQKTIMKQMKKGR